MDRRGAEGDAMERGARALLFAAALGGTGVTLALLPAAAPTTAVSAAALDLPVSVVRASAALTHAGSVATRSTPPRSAGFDAGARGLDPFERAGREIWYKATGGNGRFYAYAFPQRLGVRIDWYRVLRTDARLDRFEAFGLVNDPDCCVPGAKDCPARSAEETYGFDWCPGDETLLAFVGKAGYRDPACDLEDAPAPQDPGGARERQDACDLGFGTSAGALGLRKFPNPRFDAARWRALNGSAGTWDGYDRRLSTDPTRADSRLSHLLDGSVEPPFHVGLACGACHIGFNPLHPPADPARPRWENILGAVGNQYARFAEILVSGMATDSPEWQIFTHARPGTADTSAIPDDQIHNPGTMTPILNLAARPTFPDESVRKWRRVASCPDGADDETCWCEPGRAAKCWRKSLEKTEVHHILKGGEDSIGAAEALERVYLNIGTCAETCWVNHLTDLRQLDPFQRNYGQTPVDIGQCRRECPSFRAVEDRVEDVLRFLMSREARAVDLAEAEGTTPEGLRVRLERQYGAGAVERGRAVFAARCAGCHSSQPPPFDKTDFRRPGPRPGLRLDWMSNDDATPVSTVGTSECRALHSNHMAGHVWEEYGSETLRARLPDPIRPDAGDGRGYYRNPSLLSVWAFAPFMHDNAIGPEVCGRPANAANDFYRSPWSDERGNPLPADEAPACVPYDPSVEGRLKLYEASMEALLHPATRGRKVSRTDEPIRIDVGPRVVADGRETKLFGLTLEFPAGLPAAAFGNFQHKPFVHDLVLARRDPAALRARLAERYGPERAERMAREIGGMADDLLAHPEGLLDIVRARLDVVSPLYSSCAAVAEDGGHRFGESLPETDKRALIAFLATL
jgi:hypothetical protein